MQLVEHLLAQVVLHLLAQDASQVDETEDANGLDDIEQEIVNNDPGERLGIAGQNPFIDDLLAEKGGGRIDKGNGRDEE